MTWLWRLVVALHSGARARSWASPCKDCVCQSGTGTDYSPNGLTNSIETDTVGLVWKMRDEHWTIELLNYESAQK